MKQYTHHKNREGALRKPFVIIASILLLVFSSFLYFRYLVKKADAAWFNEGWRYRVSIAISAHTTAENNVYITLSGANGINTTDATKFQTDCGDIRFTDSGGNLLPYYLTTSCGLSQTGFHVFFNTFPSGAQTIYYYYGNAGAENGFSASDFQTAATGVTLGSTGSQELGPGPVAYLKFNEGNGSLAQDSVINTYAGTLSGATPPSWQSDDLCIDGKCLYYNGSTAYTNIGTSLSGVKSLSFWVRPKTNGEVLIDMDGGTHYITATSGVITASGFASPTIYVNGIIRSTLTANVWQHIEVTSATAFTASNITIGKHSTTFLNGFIDELKIYDYVRTPSQVKIDYSISSSTLGGRQNSTFSQGLVGYWKMDENTGTTTSDTSGNGSTLTLTNTPTWGFGKYGSGITQNGTNSYLTTTTDKDILDPRTGSISMFTWIKTGKTGTDDMIFFKGAGNATDKGYDLTPDTSTTGKLQLYISDGSTYIVNNLTGVTDVCDGNWHLVGFTWNPAVGAKLYADGKLENSISVNTTVDINSTSPLLIGGYSSTNFSLSGSIDETRAYNREFTLAEVNQLYNWAPGPVGYWRMDENNGQAITDASGNGNSGVLGSSATGDANDAVWAQGKFGGALRFDGVNDYVSISDPGSSVLDITGRVSISAWIYKTADTPTNGWADIVTKGDGVDANPTNYWLQLVDVADSEYADFYFYNGTYQELRGVTPIQLNRWYHLEVVYDDDANTIKLYVNGTLEASTTDIAGTPATSSLLTNDYPVQIGSSGYTSQEFPGLIDEVKIYNYARTSAQVGEDMNGGRSVPGSSVGSSSLYLKFDEGYGDIAHDSSPNRLDGDLAGSGGVCPGAANCPTWYNSGKLNKALDFDGLNDYVEIVDNPILDVTDSDDITISGWFNRDISGNEDTIIAKRNSLASVDVGWVVTIRATDVFDFQLSDGTDEYQMTTIQTFTSPGWNFFTVVWDQDSSDNSKIYINGIQVPITTSGTIGNVGDTSNALNLRVGTQSDGSERFDGKIDDIRIFKSTMTDSQILALYNQGSASTMGSTSTASTGVTDNSATRTYCPPGNSEGRCGSGSPTPLGEWKMDENSGITAYDASGNGNNAVFDNNMTGADWSQGKFGSGLSLVGTNKDALILNSTQFDFGTTTPFTIGGWFKARSNGLHETIVTHTGSVAGGFEIYISETTNTIRAVTGVGTHCAVAGTTNLIDNKWHYVSAVYNRNASCTTSDIIVYIDGKRESTSISDSSENSNSNIDIGGIKLGSSGDIKDIYIDNIIIYDYVRTPAQIAWDYNKGEPLYRWRFNECAGTVIHDSMSRMSAGTIIPGASSNTSAGTCITGPGSEMWGDGQSGKYGGSLGFDGGDDYVSFGNTTTIEGLPEASVCAWINYGPASVTTDGAIVSRYSGTNPGWLLWVDDSAAESGRIDTISFAVDPGAAAGTGRVEGTSGLVATGQWDHYCGVFKGGAYIRLYKNGILNKEVTSSIVSIVNNSDSANLYIGRVDNGTPRYFQGNIDEVQIFPYALTKEQVRTVGNQGAIRFGPATGSP